MKEYLFVASCHGLREESWVDAFNYSCMNVLWGYVEETPSARKTHYAIELIHYEKYAQKSGTFIRVCSI